MDLCRNCLASIPESQIYCSLECWQEARSSEVKELGKTEAPMSKLLVWISIIGMFFSLFFLLVVVSFFVEEFQSYLITSTLVLAIFVFFVLKYFYEENQFSDLFRMPKGTWRLIGIALLVDIFVVKPLHIVFTTQFFPEAQEQEVITALEEMSQSSAIITAFSVSILTPILEELLFRGFILGLLLRCYNDKVAIVISAILFAIVHEPVAIGMAFGGGLIYGWLRVKTGSIIPSTIAHMVWNSFISILILFY